MDTEPDNTGTVPLEEPKTDTSPELDTTSPDLDVHESVEYQYLANKRLGTLFETLDHNKDGFIDLAELTCHMKGLGQYGTMTEKIASVSYSADSPHNSTNTTFGHL